MHDRSTINTPGQNIRQIFTLISIIAAFGMNVWANIAPINGATIGEISNSLFGNILITPANYAFAVWGLIYLGLISFAFYQAIPAQRPNELLNKIRHLIALASWAQIVWVFLFLYRQFTLSFVAMVAILLPLIVAYLHLSWGDRISHQQQWLVRNPISIYLAWISVATIVNGAIVLASWNWNGWGIIPQIWTLVMLLIAALITHLVAIPRRDFAYAGVFVWASVAIAVRNSDDLILAGTAIGLGIVLILLLIVTRLTDN